MAYILSVTRYSMDQTTTILVEKNVRDDLRAEKSGGETYNDVIVRLLEEEGKA